MKSLWNGGKFRIFSQVWTYSECSSKYLLPDWLSPKDSSDRQGDPNQAQGSPCRTGATIHVTGHSGREAFSCSISRMTRSVEWLWRDDPCPAVLIPWVNGEKRAWLSLKGRGHSRPFPVLPGALTPHSVPQPWPRPDEGKKGQNLGENEHRWSFYARPLSTPQLSRLSNDKNSYVTGAGGFQDKMRKMYVKRSVHSFNTHRNLLGIWLVQILIL